LTKNYQKIFFREIEKLIYKKKLEGLPGKIVLKFRKNLLFFKFYFRTRKNGRFLACFSLMGGFFYPFTYFDDRPQFSM